MSYNRTECDDLDDYSDEEDDYPEFGDVAAFELFEMVGGNAQTHGALKEHKTKDGGLIYYRDDVTGFNISVERLLQADGYADSTGKQPLTLLVLKIILGCSSGANITRVVFNMSFSDLPAKGGDRTNASDLKAEPKVVAWAPFDDMAKTKETQAKRTRRQQFGLGLGGEGAGASGKVNAEWENTIEWTETYWETANSFPTFGMNQDRTGVRWVLNANPRDTQGLPPKLLVGLLLSRASAAMPYLASFDINVKGGFLHDLLKGVEKLLGRKPDQTKPYKVIPTKVPLCRSTGLKMMNRVNLSSMLELQGEGDDLKLIWNDEEIKTAERKSNPKKPSEDGASIEANAETTLAENGA